MGIYAVVWFTCNCFYNFIMRRCTHWIPSRVYQSESSHDDPYIPKTIIKGIIKTWKEICNYYIESVKKRLLDMFFSRHHEPLIIKSIQHNMQDMHEKLIKL